MRTPREKPDLRRIAGAVGFPLLMAVLIATVIVFREPLWSVFSRPESIRSWVDAWGMAAPLVFVAVQIVQVAVFIIPGETVQIAGGYLFGFWMGAGLTVLGIAGGSVINFWVGRSLGRPFVGRLFKQKRLDRIDHIAGSAHAQTGFFLLFLIPGLPKDILCYVAGMSSFRLPVFLLISMTGRLPGILGSALMGSAAAERRWALSIGLFGLATVLFVLGLALQRRIGLWIERRATRNEKT